ncbi:hypothetical protein R6Q59_032984 [Mikania micrantha]
MKPSKAWRVGMKDMEHMLPSPRHRGQMKKPTWIIVLVSLVCMFLVVSYIHPPQTSSTCYIFSASSCQTFSSWLPPSIRELSDDEIASRVVIRNILNTPPMESKNPKIAFMAMKVDFQSIFMLPKKNQSTRVLTLSKGKFTVTSCVPLRDFDYVYNYLMYTNISFIDSFSDPGPHGSGRYSEHMLPEVEKKFFRKGAQWFTMKRQHAVIVMADSLYYSKFRDYCKPGMDGVNCYADEHYLPTFFHVRTYMNIYIYVCICMYIYTYIGYYEFAFLKCVQMHDPNGIANWSVTHVDWSERKWHPKSYEEKDISEQLLKNITV